MNTNYQVIGLSGHAGSGKDYIFARYLRPRGFLQLSLSWHFKVDLIAKGVITFEEAFETKPPNVRTLLQLVGTELGRNIYGENIWCDTLKTWMDVFNFHWGSTRFAIPDVRFMSELDFIQRDLEGKVIRVVAPGRSDATSLDSTQRAHASEAEMDKMHDVIFDGIVYNDPGDPVDKQLGVLFEEFGYEYDTIQTVHT
ncbi:hypothetical protein LCGC14_1075180 [marine sediment metagenome]|uniref:Deoxynucleotide monophosphate kinase n=1 Tax=marine sediment metagenome TaxID=412755 RepID=A0A0F9N4A7_9ZZZZ